MGIPRGQPFGVSQMIDCNNDGLTDQEGSEKEGVRTRSSGVSYRSRDKVRGVVSLV